MSKKEGEFSVFPYQATKQKRTKHIQLLLLENNYDGDDDADDDGDDDNDNDDDHKNDETPYKFHYVWIKALCSKQVSNHSH